MAYRKYMKTLGSGVLLIIATCVISLSGVSRTDAATGVAYVGTIPESGIEAPAGYQATLLVDGKEVKAVAGTSYTAEDNAVVVYTSAAGLYGSFLYRGEEAYRMAVFVSEEGVVEEKSVTEAVQGGSFDGTSMSGVTIDANSDGFGGVMIVNDSEEELAYTISDSTFHFLSESDGSDVSDFTAYGTVISAFGKTKLIIDGVDIQTTGVAKAAVVADTGADVLVQNSTIHAEGGTLYDGYKNTADMTKMVSVPWVLGIDGNARGTNLLGDFSTSTFYNSTLSAAAWGVLSCDSCQNVVLTAIDSLLKITSDTGYGTYAIGNAKEYFYGTTFDVATYANIITGGYVTYASSNGTFDVKKDTAEGEVVFEGLVGAGNNSVINSDAFGIMWHGDGEANILDKTEVNTQNAAFLIKNGDVRIQVDDATIKVEDGTILQMMDNDDTTVGVYFEEGAEGPTFNTEFNEQEGYPGLDYEITFDYEAAKAAAAELAEQMPVPETPDGSTPVEVEAPEFNVIASFTNTSIDGNIYNATGYAGLPKTLGLTIGENATLTGAVSATTYIHSTDGGKTQNTYFTSAEYDKMGHVANKAYYNGYNDINVVVAKGGTWVVTEDSLITSLTVEDGGSLKAVVTIDGESIELEEGKTYTGFITLTKAVEEETTEESIDVTEESIEAESVETSQEQAEVVSAMTSDLGTPLAILALVIVIAGAAVMFYNKKK